MKLAEASMSPTSIFGHLPDNVIVHVKCYFTSPVTNQMRRPVSQVRQILAKKLILLRIDNRTAKTV